jgi:hypothetical protein
VIPFKIRTRDGIGCVFVTSLLSRAPLTGPTGPLAKDDAPIWSGTLARLARTRHPSVVVPCVKGKAMDCQRSWPSWLRTELGLRLLFQSHPRLCHQRCCFAGLAACFQEMARVLKQEGRLVFTFQQKTAAAWQALAWALVQTRLRPLQLFPLLGDSSSGLHKHSGSSKWDAVFVFAKVPQSQHRQALAVSRTQLDRCRQHYGLWVRRLEVSPSCQFQEADRRNFYRACLVAGALGLYEPLHAGRRTLKLQCLLELDPPDIAESGGGDGCRI